MTAPPVRVLLVEDTGSDVALFRRAATKSGEPHELRAEPTAETAIDLLRSGAWRPDVLVVDERLPGMTGSELVARVNADPALWHLLIFRYTAFQNDLSCDAIGKGVVHKPPAADEVAVVLRLGRAARDVLRLPRRALRDVLTRWDAECALVPGRR